MGRGGGVGVPHMPHRGLDFAAAGHKKPDPPGSSNLFSWIFVGNLIRE
jgi:hypothetical protein